MGARLYDKNNQRVVASWGWVRNLLECIMKGLRGDGNVLYQDGSLGFRV